MRWILVAALAGLMGCESISVECVEDFGGAITSALCDYPSGLAFAACLDADGNRPPPSGSPTPPCSARGAEPKCFPGFDPTCGDCFRDADCGPDEVCDGGTRTCLGRPE